MPESGAVFRPDALVIRPTMQDGVAHRVNVMLGRRVSHPT